MIKDASISGNRFYSSTLEDLNLDSESYIQNNTLIIGTLYMCFIKL
jgi:transposase